MAAAYAGMHLWAKAIEAADSDRVADIRQAMVEQQFEAPEGLVRIDPKNQRAVRRSGIGQINDDLEFDVISMSPKPIPPVAFPPTASRQAWEQFVDSLYARWGGWTPTATAAATARRIGRGRRSAVARGQAARAGFERGQQP